MDASKLLGAPTFMTMGNHECGFGSYCTTTTGDANSTAFREALAPTSSNFYYTFDITTGSGAIATFVIVADNAWDATQQSWLEQTLTRADTRAKWTIVARHHPWSNTQYHNTDIRNIITSHKYTLFLTGHSHEYAHPTYDDPSGRTVTAGMGGAPPAAGSTFYGYGIVEQQADDRLAVTIYDQASSQAQDSWSVPPQ
jgi:hypothetical protein